MFEFGGEFSEESRRYLLKKNALVSFLGSLVASVLLGTIIILIAAAIEMWEITLFLIVLVFFIALSAAFPYMQREKTLSMLVPQKIIIDKEGNIYYELSKQTITKTLPDVKRVIDFEEWYYIEFNFPKVDGFLCQKNLIMKGTLRDFEKLFEGKIVKKKYRPKNKGKEV